MSAVLRLSAALAAVLFGAAPSGAVTMERARLQGLDKITARVSTIEAPVGQPVTFGALEITVRAESAAYLEIVERKTNEEPKMVFSGWMFASSPAVSAMEHPVYDIWVLDCMSASTAETGTSQ